MYFSIDLEQPLRLQSFLYNIKWITDDLASESCNSSNDEIKEFELVELYIVVFEPFLEYTVYEKTTSDIRNDAYHSYNTSFVESQYSLVLVDFD